MRRVPRLVIYGLTLALSFLPLHAQGPTGAPAAQTAGGQAPDEATKKISEMVHAGNYADAQKLTDGLLLVYPNDQRLIKAQALIQKLMAGGSPAPGNSAPVASAQGEQLTGMDKVEYNSLIELARQAQMSTDPDEQSRLLQQFMEQSNPFLVKHPKELLLWQLRAAASIGRNNPIEGYQAGQALISLGAADSSDPNLQQLMAKLQLLGWLDKEKAWDLQHAADNQRKQAQVDAEDAKYIFPVGHSTGMHYAYGHLSIRKDEAVYVGSDETDHINRNDVRELKVQCLGGGFCGMYFTPKSGRKYLFIVLTEAQVAAATTSGGVPLPPSTLGDAVVARWGFVLINKETLGPPGSKR